jgi:pyridoxine/pyridoxamine 5'-phosphate oxidase
LSCFPDDNLLTAQYRAGLFLLMKLSHDPSASRYEHVGKGLRRSDLNPDPIKQFGNWFTAAIEADIRDANAMSLATSGLDARPSVRIVLLKSFDQDLFFTITRAKRQPTGRQQCAARVLLDRSRPANSHQRKVDKTSRKEC